MEYLEDKLKCADCKWYSKIEGKYTGTCRYDPVSHYVDIQVQSEGRTKVDLRRMCVRTCVKFKDNS